MENLKLIKTMKILEVIKFKVIEFNNYLEKDKDINFENLNKIINNISVCSHINNDLTFYLRHQKALLESFHRYEKPVIYYLKKNNLQLIKFLEDDIKKDRNIFK